MASSCVHAAIILLQKHLGAVVFVMAKPIFEFKPVNLEDVPNVVISRPSIDDELPSSKCNTGCICSGHSYIVKNIYTGNKVKPG